MSMDNQPRHRSEDATAHPTLHLIAQAFNGLADKAFPSRVIKREQALKLEDDRRNFLAYWDETTEIMDVMAERDYLSPQGEYRSLSYSEQEGTLTVTKWTNKNERKELKLTTLTANKDTDKELVNLISHYQQEQRPLIQLEILDKIESMVENHLDYPGQTVLREGMPILVREVEMSEYAENPGSLRIFESKPGGGSLIGTIHTHNDSSKGDSIDRNQKPNVYSQTMNDLIVAGGKPGDVWLRPMPPEVVKKMVTDEQTYRNLSREASNKASAAGSAYSEGIFNAFNPKDIVDLGLNDPPFSMGINVQNYYLMERLRSFIENPERAWASVQEGLEAKIASYERQITELGIELEQGRMKQADFRRDRDMYAGWQQYAQTTFDRLEEVQRQVTESLKQVKESRGKEYARALHENEEASALYYTTIGSVNENTHKWLGHIRVRLSTQT